jgi:hypothetical protein
MDPGGGKNAVVLGNESAHAKNVKKPSAYRGEEPRLKVIVEKSL